MKITEEAYLAHYGILRKSGRYPWGSGGNVPSSAVPHEFLDYVSGLRKEGASDNEIARALGITSAEFRNLRSRARAEVKMDSINTAQKLKDTGMSNVAIGKEMGIGESQVRALLAPGAMDKAQVLTVVANRLRDEVDEKGYIDVGTGTENYLGVSETRMKAAIAILKDEGYVVHPVQIDQVGTGPGQKTTIKTLCPPGTTYREVATNTDKIQQIQSYSEDGGRTMLGIVKPIGVDPSRIAVKYNEDGGGDADGVIYVRPGVDDLTLGTSRYAQVRIQVGDTHYLKGMAMYKNDLPEGVDLMFNTNKSDTGNKLDAMKPLKDDPDNPFGAIVRQLPKLDSNGNEIPGTVRSAMNIVNEEGNWETWRKTISSQVLSKQSPTLAKTQLDMSYERAKADLDEIMALTNPAVKKRLLESYADGADSAAVHLKAAALPRQRSQVILPIDSLKDTEVYAPNFRHGERVALIRYPHGGTFEIPELTVNNKHPEAKALLGPGAGGRKDPAQDAIGINSRVAARLSGADFDGDTVLVIPNPASNPRIKTTPALKELQGFDPQSAYKGYEGMKKMDAATKAMEMGNVSNLITDMTIKGAPMSEIARAVKHSMVVIDAEKHGLDWKRSEADQGIRSLKAKYQDGSNKGASTLISRASSEKRVNARSLRRASEGGPIDPITGRKVYVDKPGWIDANGKEVHRKQKSTKLAETDDAYTLVSKPGTPIEKVYADHSNRMKALANRARLETLRTKDIPYDPSARTAYAKEVASLNAKVQAITANRPKERQAQVLANKIKASKLEDNPHLEADEKKRIGYQAIEEARRRTNAKKPTITFEDREWEAIQNGAISTHKLNTILRNADLDQVKALATPRKPTVMTPTKQNRAAAMIAAGYTQAEIADHLGVSLSTLKNYI